MGMDTVTAGIIIAVVSIAYMVIGGSLRRRMTLFELFLCLLGIAVGLVMALGPTILQLFVGH